MTEEITLEQRQAVETLRRRWRHESSSHAFASLYIWRRAMRLSLYCTPQLFAVRAGWLGPNAWFFPCGDPREAAAFVQARLADGPLTLAYARRQDVALLDAALPGLFTARRAPEDDEYLYRRDALAALRGRAYRSQRTALNHLRRTMAPVCRPLDARTLADAAAVLDAARQRPAQPGAHALTDAGADCLADHMAVGAAGLVVYAAGRPAAVAAGYPLSGTAFDISLCRLAVPAPDLAVYARTMLYRSLPPACTVINAEEDLGLPGLRTLKQVMNPYGKIEMFCCTGRAPC